MNASQGAPLNVVAFGGGTGMPVILQGMKDVVSDITAVVVVSDDGGSSGELRALYDMPAPGDLRNVITALSDGDPALLSLLQYRFDDPILKGHNFGNLAIAALMKVEGSFEKAIQSLCRLAKVKGRVIPMAYQKLALVATHQDGSTSTGEVTVSNSDKPISRMRLLPEPEMASEECLQAIDKADIVVFGPGSLLTSIIPHLLIPGVVEALKKASAKVVYVSNIMTEPGETTGFDLKDHVNALFQHGLPRLDAVLCHNGDMPEALKQRYEKSGAQKVLPGELPANVELWVDNFLEEGDMLRHSSKALVQHLLSHVRRMAS